MSPVIGRLLDIPPWFLYIDLIITYLRLHQIAGILAALDDFILSTPVWFPYLVATLPTLGSATVATVQSSIVVQVLALRLLVPSVIRPRLPWNMHWVIGAILVYLLDLALVWALFPHLSDLTGRALDVSRVEPHAGGYHMDPSSSLGDLAMCQAMEHIIVLVFVLRPVFWLVLWATKRTVYHAIISLLQLARWYIFCVHRCVFRPAVMVVDALIWSIELACRLCDGRPGTANAMFPFLRLVLPFRVGNLCNDGETCTASDTLAPCRSTQCYEEKKKAKRSMRMVKRRASQDKKTYKRKLSTLGKKYLMLSSENTSMQNHVDAIHSASADLLSDDASLRSCNAALQSANATLTSANTKLQSEVAALRSGHDRVHSQNITLWEEEKKHRVMISSLESKKVELVKERVEFRSHIAKLESTNKNLISDNTMLQSHIAAVELENAGLMSRSEELRVERDTSCEEAQALQTDRDSLFSDNRLLRSECADLKARLGAGETGRDALRSRLNKSCAERDTLASRCEDLQSQLGLSSDNYNALHARCVEIQACLDATETGRSLLHAERDDLKSRLEASILERDDLRTQLDTEQSDLEAARLMIRDVQVRADVAETQQPAADTHFIDLPASELDGASMEVHLHTLPLDVTTSPRSDAVLHDRPRSDMEVLRKGLGALRQQQLVRRRAATVASSSVLDGSFELGNASTEVHMHTVELDHGRSLQQDEIWCDYIKGGIDVLSRGLKPHRQRESERRERTSVASLFTAQQGTGVDTREMEPQQAPTVGREIETDTRATSRQDGHEGWIGRQGVDANSYRHGDDRFSALDKRLEAPVNEDAPQEMDSEWWDHDFLGGLGAGVYQSSPPRIRHNAAEDLSFEIPTLPSADLLRACVSFELALAQVGEDSVDVVPVDLCTEVTSLDDAYLPPEWSDDDLRSFSESPALIRDSTPDTQRRDCSPDIMTPDDGEGNVVCAPLNGKIKALELEPGVDTPLRCHHQQLGLRKRVHAA